MRSWREPEGAQPSIMVEEFLACEEIVRQDPRWQEAMRKRGVTDFSLVMIDPWASGYSGPEDTGPAAGAGTLRGVIQVTRVRPRRSYATWITDLGA